MLNGYKSLKIPLTAFIIVFKIKSTYSIVCYNICIGLFYMAILGLFLDSHLALFIHRCVINRCRNYG